MVLLCYFGHGNIDVEVIPKQNAQDSPPSPSLLLLTYRAETYTFAFLPASTLVSGWQPEVKLRGSTGLLHWSAPLVYRYKENKGDLQGIGRSQFIPHKFADGVCRGVILGPALCNVFISDFDNGIECTFTKLDYIKLSDVIDTSEEQNSRGTWRCPRSGPLATP
ncbi:hypothetical protein TURU_083109 [Turdus rufiventris]|nr:hypothetical protein TURU_083109 [Turdus rufiventris]